MDTYQPLGSRVWDKGLVKSLFVEIPESDFRVDESSSEIRNRGKNGFWKFKRFHRIFRIQKWSM